MRYTPNQILISKEREQGRRSLVWFIRHAWPLVEKTEYRHNWHIELIAAHLEAVTRGELRKLVINVPPGSMKSLEVCVFWSAWQWIINPTTAQLFTSFDIGLTTRDAEKVRTIISSEWFQARWGHRAKVNLADPVREFECYDAEGQFTGGWRYSTSVDGKTTGRHPDVRVIDDPTKPKNVTKAALEETKLWWQNTMRSRARDPATVATVLIMQRLAEDDLAGYFLEEGGWTHVCIPLEYDSSRPCSTPWGKDPRTAEGESFWPNRFTLDVIREIKKETPDVATWSAQYAQNPSPPGGNLFKVEWITKRWKELPESGVWASSWDFAVKGESTSDWVVGQTWLQFQSSYFLVDQVRERADFNRSKAMLRGLTSKWPKTQAKLIEDKANGPAIINELSGSIPGLVPIKVGSDSKYSRAVACTPAFAAGNVWLPESGSNEWTLDYERELLAFPKARNDDQVDATSQYLNWAMTQGTADYATAMANWRKTMGRG